MSDFYNHEGSNKLTSAATAYQGENQDLKFSLSPYVNAGIITSSTVIVQPHPAGPQNYTWCKYCSSEKSSVIRFQLFETFRIAHINSIFDWRKETIKTKWVAFDEDSWTRHKHDATGPLPLSILVGRQRNRLSENNNNNHIIEVTAKAKTSKLLCDCPGSKEGRIIVDPKAHLPECRFRRKISSNRYCVDTSVTPEDFKDGYGLGVTI